MTDEQDLFEDEDPDDNDLIIEIDNGPILILREAILSNIEPDAQKWLEHCASRIFDVLGLSDQTEATIVLTDDVEIQELNAQWRHKDEATDVLSFAYQEAEDGFVVPDLLGDIVISIETAQRYAQDAHHATWLNQEDGEASAPWTLQNELAFLIGHGFLHLLGFDHIEPEDEQVMRPLERSVYDTLTSDAKVTKRAAPLKPNDFP